MIVLKSEYLREARHVPYPIINHHYIFRPTRSCLDDEEGLGLIIQNINI